jgi:hypothetical protein
MVQSVLSLLPPPATPVAPIILSVNSTSPTSFHIEWLFSGVPTFISDYIIEIQNPPNSTAPWTPVHNKSAGSITIADIISEDQLDAFTLYGVRIVAMYTNGDRVPSNQEVILTGTDRPADSPRDVTGAAQTNTALDISWNVSC